MGMRCDASQVLILTGSQQGIDLVSKLLIDPGTPVLLEAPTYLAALQSFQFLAPIAAAWRWASTGRTWTRCAPGWRPSRRLPI